MRDAFRTFGFPEDEPGGVPLSVRADDCVQRDRTLRLVPGQVALEGRVFRDWASRDAAEQGRVGPGEQIRWSGEILSTALLTNRIGDEFHELIAGADVGWVEVAVHFAEVQDDDFTEFVQVLWEHQPEGRCTGGPQARRAGRGERRSRRAARAAASRARIRVSQLLGR